MEKEIANSRFCIKIVSYSSTNLHYILAHDCIYVSLSTNQTHLVKVSPTVELHHQRHSQSHSALGNFANSWGLCVFACNYQVT